MGGIARSVVYNLPGAANPSSLYTRLLAVPRTRPLRCSLFHSMRCFVIGMAATPGSHIRMLYEPTCPDCHCQAARLWTV
jgi:hypothetical protein